MLKKMTVLAMAVGVVAALALPTTASAVWKEHNTAIGTDIDLSLTGNVAFHGQIGGVECQITSTATFFAGQTTGTADTFTPHPTDDTANCKGTGGLGPCQVHNLTPQHPSWTFHTKAVQTVQAVQGGATTLGGQHVHGIQVTTQDITSQLTGGIFCLVKHIKLTAGTVGIVGDKSDPNPGTTVQAVELNGTLIADIQTNSGTVHQEEVLTTGTLQIEEAAKRNKYSF